jgi:ribonuclease HI
MREIASTAQEGAAAVDKSVPKRKEDFVVVYADGSCIRNGSTDAVGGVGVFFSPGDERNLSLKITSSLDARRVTAQRAELYAGLMALEKAADVKRLQIRSDSSYLIKVNLRLIARRVNWRSNQQGMKSWLRKWSQHTEWTTTDGQAVRNKDLVSYRWCRATLEECFEWLRLKNETAARSARSFETTWTWTARQNAKSLSSPDGDISDVVDGNFEANKLAQLASRSQDT